MRLRYSVILVTLCSLACGGTPTTSSTVGPPNMAGTWIGGANIVCGDTTGTGFCNAVPPRSSFSLSAAQTGSDVTATVTFGGTANGSTSGKIANNGSITFDPFIYNQVLSASSTVIWQFSSLNFQVTNNILSGSFHVTLTIPGASGTGDIDATLLPGVTRQ